MPRVHMHTSNLLASTILFTPCHLKLIKPGEYDVLHIFNTWIILQDLRWAECLFHFSVDLCLRIIHEDCRVRITFGHLSLALSVRSKFRYSTFHESSIPLEKKLCVNFCFVPEADLASFGETRWLALIFASSGHSTPWPACWLFFGPYPIDKYPPDT